MQMNILNIIIYIAFLIKTARDCPVGFHPSQLGAIDSIIWVLENLECLRIS